MQNYHAHECSVCGRSGKLTAFWAYELPNGDLHNARVHQRCREVLQRRFGIIPDSKRELVTA